MLTLKVVVLAPVAPAVVGVILRPGNSVKETETVAATVRLIGV